MLKLTDLRKSYTTFDFTQTALDGVSVAFRDNEFASILGPSGSGKTTLLNIIGGLDHYDSGDLEIDGISTKLYKSSDWDTYRNNRIGFVFQSYNLIPHQTILANVELALTLSGVSPTERKERAIEALKEVGLGDHIRKLPNQLSGGQMQRVAIARALINDPEILLADEPTGALDTNTSEQVMDLLTRISKDRLVIMVTHNSELAKQYSNRIIQLKDGQITSDTNPYDPLKEGERTGRAPHKVSMSFLTAISLSLSNLMTKKGRTFVTSLAGSIGIIGIAAILALASGINAYIKNTEQETMSIYPLTIQSSGIDLSSFLGGAAGSSDEQDNNSSNDGSGNNSSGNNSSGNSSSGNNSSTDDDSFADESLANVPERKIIESVFNYQTQNDLASLKTYIEDNEDEINPYVKNIQYEYDLVPQIYLADTTKDIYQVSPDALMSTYGLEGSSGISSILGNSSMTSMNVFYEMPGGVEMFDYQYDVLAGHWPESYDEAVLVLNANGSVSDYTLYSLGLNDRSELKLMLESMINNSEDDVNIEENKNFTYEELMSAKLKVIISADTYVYDNTYNIWIDKSDNAEYMRSLIADGLDLKIVGVVQANADSAVSSLSPGINYTPELVSYMMDQASDKEVVKEQIENPRVNILTGKTFTEENEENDFALTDLFTIDEEAMKNAFQIDSSQIGFDLSGLSDLSLDMNSMDSSSLNMDGLTDSLSGEITIPSDQLSAVMTSTIQGFLAEEASKEILSNEQISADLTSYLSRAEVQEQIAAVMTEASGSIQIDTLLSTVLQNFLSEEAANGVTDPDQMAEDLSAYLARQDVREFINAELTQSLSTVQFGPVFTSIIQGFFMEEVNKGVLTISEDLTAYLAMADVQQAISTQLASALGSVQSEISSTLQNNIESAVQSYMVQMMASVQTQLTEQMEGQMEEALAGLPEQLTNAISIDSEAISNAFKLNMTEDELLGVLSTLMNPTQSTYENNLLTLGYADKGSPSQINIYSLDFNSKVNVEEFLDKYNNQMEAEGKEEQVINYTDLVGTMMSSVTDIVDTISYALIAFVSISLVVSSIMIGVITYISVLERKKEIGILRAIGASKRDVRRVFNAETLIVGFVAGAIGVVTTYLISIIANILVYNAIGIENIAQLPFIAALVLIGISMLLAFLSGLFPSSAAARKDPVEALRSE